MKFAFLIVILCTFFFAHAQENNLLDQRKLFFYVFDSLTTKKEIITKSLGKISDTLLIKDIALFFEKENGFTDTIPCEYKNNTIFFTKIDTLQNNINQINLSVKFYLSSKRKHFVERLTFPYKPMFEQTNTTSSVSVSFERKRNNLYRISISKLDYPFIISTFYIPSEIIGLYGKFNSYKNINSKQ